MTTRYLDSPLVYTEADMQDGEYSQLGPGTAIVFSARSPDKTSLNEDAAAIIPITKETAVLVVADGLGGHPAGGQASSITIKTIVSGISTAGQNEGELREAVLSGIEQANQRLIENGSGLATTLAVVEIQDNSVRPYHVGDSMILITGQRGKVKLETVSHSPVGYAVESGILSETDAFSHEERHVVSNIVGSPEMHISIGIPTCLSLRDTLLIATDGLFDNLQKEEILEIIRKGPLQKCALSLIKTARQRMGQGENSYKPDDMTFILYRPDPRMLIAGKRNK